MRLKLESESRKKMVGSLSFAHWYPVALLYANLGCLSSSSISLCAIAGQWPWHANSSWIPSKRTRETWDRTTVAWFDWKVWHIWSRWCWSRYGRRCQTIHEDITKQHAEQLRLRTLRPLVDTPFIVVKPGSRDVQPFFCSLSHLWQGRKPREKLHW